MLVFLDLWLSDQACLKLLPEPIRVALDIDRCRVVEDPVEAGGRDHRVPEDLVSLREAVCCECQGLFH
jgi:hypothetical protein